MTVCYPEQWEWLELFDDIVAAEGEVCVRRGQADQWFTADVIQYSRMFQTSHIWLMYRGWNVSAHHKVGQNLQLKIG